MRIRTVIFALGTVFCGACGCASVFAPFAGAPHSTIQGTQATQLASSSDKSTVQPPLDPPLLALVQQQDKQDIEFFQPISATSIRTASKLSEKKTDDPKSRDKPNKPADEIPTSLEKAPGPRADDRLLILVEKDLDKAIEQPTERRQLQFSKEVMDNPKVRYFINYFSKSAKGHLETLLARSGKYMPMIASVLRDEGLPEELAYLALLESGFVNNTASPQGAAGLWQMVAPTARKYGLRIDSWIDERRDPIKSTRAAAAYLKALHSYYGRWYLATAAYNAGPGAIDKAIHSTGAKDFWSLSEKAKLSEETLNFVPKFVAVSLIAADPKKYGFMNIRYELPWEYQEAEINTPVKLEALAEMTGTELSTLKDLNPSLLQNITPPGEKNFPIKLPAGKGLLVAKAQSQENGKVSEPAAQVVTHEVRRGETLFSIARRYGQEVRALMQFNGLNSTRLRIGQKLKIVMEELRGTLH
jgi:membrane-bound lytic murein transglycosylase D